MSFIYYQIVKTYFVDITNGIFIADTQLFTHFLIIDLFITFTHVVLCLHENIGEFCKEFLTDILRKSNFLKPFISHKRNTHLFNRFIKVDLRVFCTQIAPIVHNNISVTQNTWDKFIGIFIGIASYFVEPFFVCGFGDDNQNPLRLSVVQCCSCCSNGRHCFSHTHIKSIDAAAHSFHKSNSFTLNRCELQDTAFKISRAFKGNWNPLMVNI